MEKEMSITVSLSDNKALNDDDIAFAFQEAMLLTLSEKKLLTIEQYNSAIKLLSNKKRCK